MRDPIFIVLEVMAGLAVRRWWHMLLASAVIGIGYSLYVSSTNGVLIHPISFVGRVLSVVVVCSFFGLVRTLVTRTKQGVT